MRLMIDQPRLQSAAEISFDFHFYRNSSSCCKLPSFNFRNLHPTRLLLAFFLKLDLICTDVLGRWTL